MLEGGHVPQSLLFWGVVVLFPMAVLGAVLSALLERSGPIRLRHWAEEADGSLRKLFETPVRFAVFRYLLSLLSRAAPVVLYVVLRALLVSWHRAWPGLWALGIVLALVAATEALIRTLVGKDPERALRALTLLYRVALWLLAPLVALFAPLVPSGAFERHGHEDGEDGEASDEEIEAFIDVGTREGILEPEEGEWLWGIVGFGDTQARSVMTPRIDLVCAPLDASLDTLADRFIESGHSRMPIFEDSVDHIVGILHIRDVLRALRSPEPPHLSDLLKPPLFIPETKPLGELLRELQARFQQVAIVVDEYGGTAGLVTVEDLLEEIVGEIMDEHEALAAELEPLGDGSYRLDGRAHIELLDELFKVEIEDPEYETVAGLIFSELGYVPQVGEQVETHGLRFTVEAVDDRRIQTVRVERIDHLGGAEESKEAEA
ncbi:MAG: magnesium and cobalt exporter, family [Acidobacteriota bacterium]|jgi:CBS domain containing-hemolysin-like protein|nr:magnesium and cobalt exporter, family [Acidobacteriota bacterium]